MITFYRSAVILPGKTPKAIEFAKEIAALIKKLSGVDVNVGMPVGGNPNRIGWSSSYESLAQMEAAMTKMTTSKKYWDTLGKTSELFVAGSVNDEIWRGV